MCTVLADKAMRAQLLAKIEAAVLHWISARSDDQALQPALAGSRSKTLARGAGGS